MAVTAGVKYKLKFGQQGQLDSGDAQGDWRVRTQFYNARGADIGLQEACAGSTIPATWQEKGCYFIAPGSAASVKLQLWLVQAAGWHPAGSHFDELSLASKAAGSGSYYYFGGQRIAMLDEEGLKYIHTDHLGSTTRLTDDEDGRLG